MLREMVLAGATPLLLALASKGIEGKKFQSVGSGGRFETSRLHAVAQHQHLRPTVKGFMAGSVTERLVLATGLLQPLYKFSSLARRTQSANQPDRFFGFLPPLSLGNEKKTFKVKRPQSIYIEVENAGISFFLHCIYTAI